MPLNKAIVLRENQVISGNFGSYQLKELRGEGAYGRVARCINRSTNQILAIKISRLRRSRDTRHEAQVLRRLSSRRHNKNVVKFITSFQYQDHYCLVLEHLDQSMFDFMERRQWKPLDLSDIRYITEQLLEAFEELAKYKLIHGDLKPDNIMLVNHKLHPFKIKLIDFGFATAVKSLIRGSVLQAGRYRAPEVTLGAKLDEAVDIWSVGCVLAFLFTGRDLFPVHKYENMRMITQIQGMPNVQQLREGLFTDNFFKKTGGRYHLHSPKEYMDKTRKPYNPSNHKASRSFTCLENMSVHHPQPISKEEKKAHRQFFYLLKKLLQVNPAKRITPGEALKHPFIKQTTASRGSTLETTNVKERKASKTPTVDVQPVLQNEPGRKVTSADVRRSPCTPNTQGGSRTSPESCKKTARKCKRLSNSEDERILETSNKKMHNIQERVSAAWVTGTVETESDDDFGSECSKEERSVKPEQGQPVLQNEPGRKVTSTDVGRSPCIPITQGESTKRPNQSKDRSEKNSERLPVSAQTFSHFAQNGPSSVWTRIVKVLVNTLMKRLFQFECGLDPKDKLYVAITDDLTQTLLRIYIPEKQVQQVDVSKKKFIMGMIKDLKKEFGPPPKLFKKATSEVDSFVASAESLFQKNLQDVLKTCQTWKP